GCDRRSGALVRIVGEPAADAGLRLHEDFVLRAAQSIDAGRGERDSVFVVLDLAYDADVQDGPRRCWTLEGRSRGESSPRPSEHKGERVYPMPAAIGMAAGARSRRCRARPRAHGKTLVKARPAPLLSRPSKSEHRGRLAQLARALR